MDIQQKQTNKYDLPVDKIKSDMLWILVFAVFAIAAVIILKILLY